MAKFDKEIIGSNIMLLREAIGLSRLNFSHLIEISPRTIANIESGMETSNLGTLEKILMFYNLELNDLLKQPISIPLNFREDIVGQHKNNKELLNLLLKQPTIVYAIKYKLLKSEFLNKPREIAEVKTYFEQFGWSFLGTSISNALKRMPKYIVIKKHDKKKNTNVYMKIQTI